MTITPDKIPGVLELHRKWLRDEEGGQRAYLQRADLRGADLLGADLLGAVYAFASVSFLGHGECGRTLTAFRRNEGDAPTLQCGCFYGNTTELRAYIANGESKYRTTRTLALDTVLMLLDAKNDNA